MDGHTPAASTAVPLTSRGLAYGDGLFETIAVRGGRVTYWERHLLRLIRGCHRLGFTPPDADDARALVEATCEGHPNCVVKLFAVRAAGGRGYRPDPGAQAELYAHRAPLPAPDACATEEGVDLPLLPMRLNPAPAIAGLKHLNRLEQVLASAALGEFQEGLLLDRHGRLIEGTRTNLFLVRNNRLLTPRLEDAGVAGVLREAILDWARSNGVAHAETDLFPFHLTRCDEAMLVNSVIGIWPVRRVLIGPEHHVFSTLSPGPMTRRLQTLFDPACAP